MLPPSKRPTTRGRCQSAKVGNHCNSASEAPPSIDMAIQEADDDEEEINRIDMNDDFYKHAFM